MSEFGKCSNGHEMKCLLSTTYCPECESPKNFAEKKEEKNTQQKEANEGPEKIYYKRGARFRESASGEHILAQVDGGRYAMISLKDGNRFTNSMEIKKDGFGGFLLKTLRPLFGTTGKFTPID